ncbi:SCO2322 family protein [Streptomyces sp. AJS327]|uniref:SCO2322 family protein n=1 Tax=Streptomyces sp. AJS327 TaxID=2545265 RepID=UPI0035B51CA1
MSGLALAPGALAASHSADRAAAPTATRAAAAEQYRYWSFWERSDDTWRYATQGPATLRPGEGDTVAFRFAVSEDSRDAKEPRRAPTFAATCGDTDRPDGGKRVLVHLDFGTKDDAPRGETPPAPRSACAAVDADASAADALAKVTKGLRYDSGSLLCAIDGYPGRGCGEPAGDGSGADEADAADEPGDSDGLPSWVGITAGAVGVAALGAGAAWQIRRRRG